MDIERLAREAYKDESLQPPAGAWEEIERQMAARRRHTAWWVGCVVAVAGVAALLLWPRQEVPPREAMAQTVAAEALPAEASVVDIVGVVPLPDSRMKSAAAPAAEPDGQQRMECSVEEVVVPAIPVPQEAAPAPEPPTPTPAPTPSMLTSASQAVPSAPQTSPLAESAPPVAAQPIDTASTPADEHPFILIPNHLTAQHSCFVLPNLEQYRTVEVQLFTARGKRVYMNKHYDNTFCATHLPSGDYFYVVRVIFPDGCSQIRRGALVVEK